MYLNHLGRGYWPSLTQPPEADGLAKAIGYSSLGLLLVPVLLSAVDQLEGVIHLWSGLAFLGRLTFLLSFLAVIYFVGRLAREGIRLAYRKLPRSWKSTAYRRAHRGS